MGVLAGGAFSEHATFSIGGGSRVVAGACCPTMDLVVVVTRTDSSGDRLVLWRMQGGKVWDRASDDDDHTPITHLA